MTPVVLALHDIVKHYRRPRQRLWAPGPVVQALRGVSLQVRAGQSMGIVGESGSGKSTLARVAMALERPTLGSVRWSGQDPNALDASDLRLARRHVQMVFQDPYGSLDPRQRIGQIVAEALESSAVAKAREQVEESLLAVGLSERDADKYPHEFSGGQRQRIAIARALITRPRLIVADEPVSALDVSVQAQVLNLLADLQEALGLTYLFISHDLAVVNHVCDEVAVMYAGRIVELGTPGQLFQAAAHPYTRALVGELPRDRPGVAHGPRRRLQAQTSVRVQAGPTLESGACAYAQRCAYRQARCQVEAPELRVISQGHQAACHVAESVMVEHLGEQ